MISDFIWLEQVEKESGHLCFTCSLPDPDLNNDDDMIVCGTIKCLYNDCLPNNEITISLFDNFVDLCVGDTYQRAAFVQTISFLLCTKYGVGTKDSFFYISDCWGTCEGTIDNIDKVIREVRYE